MAISKSIDPLLKMMKDTAMLTFWVSVVWYPYIIEYIWRVIWKHDSTNASKATQPPVDWIDTGYYGQYFGDNVYAKIYKRIIRAGLHVIALKDAALLFTSSGTSVSKPSFHFWKEQYDNNLKCKQWECFLFQIYWFDRTLPWNILRDKKWQYVSFSQWCWWKLWRKTQIT